MKDRVDLRKHFTDISNQNQMDKSFGDLATRISSSEETIANAFKALLDLIDGKTTKTEVVNQLTSISTPDVARVVEAVVRADKDKLTAKDLKTLETSLNKAVRELSLIPKTQEKFEQRETVKVTNLSEIKQDNSDIIKAIEKLDIKPVVDIKTPIVNVEKTDMKPLEDLTRDVLKATRDNKPIEQKFPKIPKADLTNLEKGQAKSNEYLKVISEKKMGSGGGGGNGTPYIDGSGKPMNVILDNGAVPYTKQPQAKKITVAAPFTYIAVASPGTAQATAKWQVQRIDDTTAGTTIIEWADGDADFDNVATDLTVLSYS